jgi:hypothetical protein
VGYEQDQRSELEDLEVLSAFELVEEAQQLHKAQQPRGLRGVGREAIRRKANLSVKHGVPGK